MTETLFVGSRSGRTRRVALAGIVAGILGGTLVASHTHAACSLIPNLQGSFRGALGLANRPYASPGDVVELAVRPTVCDGESQGIRSRRNGDYVASVIFTPPAGPLARNHVVVVATGCDALADELAACEAHPAVAAARCLEASAPGEPRSLALVSRNGERRLSLRFPDTDALLGQPDDGRTLAGPATIAVTTRGAPLPCGLATTRCADADASLGLVACVDELYDRDGSCRTAATNQDGTFASFTALPSPNDYRAILGVPRPGGPAGDEVRFTVDRAGNVLVPIDWRAPMVTKAGGDDRRLRGARTTAALLERAGSVTLPGDAFVGSFTPVGDTLPAMFEPGTRGNEPSLFGTTDVSFSVLRLARRSATLAVCAHGPRSGEPCATAADCPEGTCGTARCTAGPRAGRTCAHDTECPEAECGRGLFEFRDRLVSGVGPIVIPEPAPGPSHEACLIPAGGTTSPVL